MWLNRSRLPSCISVRILRCANERTLLTISGEGEADMKLWGKLGELGTVCVDFWRIREEVSNIPTPAQPLPTPRSTGRKHRGRGNKQQKSSGNQNANMNPPDVSTPLLAEDEVPEKNLKERAISHQAKYIFPFATSVLGPIADPH